MIGKRNLCHGSHAFAAVDRQGFEIITANHAQRFQSLAVLLAVTHWHVRQGIDAGGVGQAVTNRDIAASRLRHTAWKLHAQIGQFRDELGHGIIGSQQAPLI